jgi:hypothetical protein
MECRKWEELGLLYSAEELGVQESRDYEEHCTTCDTCRTELSCYRAERARFFSPQILGAAPSAEVDAEILRVCSDPRPKVRIAAPSLFPAFLRRAFVPAALFIIGFISVGYIMMNMENARQMKTAAVQVQKATVVVEQQVAAVPANAADSVKDSLHNPNLNYARTRGNLNDKGVMPVDLKK